LLSRAGKGEDASMGRDLIDLSEAERRDLWKKIADATESYRKDVSSLPLFPKVTAEQLRADISRFTFETPQSADEILNFAIKHLRESHLQIPHPAYFGVFNPAAAPMGVAGEWLTAAFNPQLASWTSSPFAIELEQHLIRWWGEKFGLPQCEGTFTSGGTEANHTALLTALTKHFPEFGARGVRGLTGDPVLYASKETHHSILKASRLCGLGTEALREIEVDPQGRLRPETLRAQIQKDRREGKLPCFVTATAGTTGHGVIDPLNEIAEVARAENIWFHIDAAWGGPAILVPELRPLFAGIERADSLTLDTHKWLNLPMTAGIFLTSEKGILRKTFSVEFSSYMPVSSHESPLHQPYQESMSWSRRFQGLKLFLALAVAGEEGYCETLRHQVNMGAALRNKLSAAGWTLVNETPLPVVCFEKAGTLPAETIAKAVADSGMSWITTTGFEGRTVLRAGISNYRTTEKDLDILIEALTEALKTKPATK